VGMSEGLSLPGREALRTVMQWDDGPAGGFSTATDYLIVRLAISRATSAHKRSMSAHNSAIGIR